MYLSAIDDHNNHKFTTKSVQRKYSQTCLQETPHYIPDDMYMALFSMWYGFIPAQVSKSSYEPLGDARFGDKLTPFEPCYVL